MSIYSEGNDTSYGRYHRIGDTLFRIFPHVNETSGYDTIVYFIEELNCDTLRLRWLKPSFKRRYPNTFYAGC